MSRVGRVSSTIALVLVASVVHAQAEDARTTRARELFTRGSALAAEERWADALAAFEQSALLLPHGATTYNVGYCERALGHPTRARRALRAALQRPELPAAMRGEAERYAAEADAKVGRVALTVASPTATVTVDGRPLERAEGVFAVPVLLAGTRDPGPGDTLPATAVEVWMDPGSHVVTMSAPDGFVDTKSVRLTAGGSASVAFDHATREPAPRAVALTAPRHGDGSRRSWAWGVGVAGAAGVVAGGWLGLRASTRWSDAKAACPARSTCPDDRGAQLSADARRDANLSTAAFVFGAAALASSVVLFTTSDGWHVAATPTPGNVGLRLGGRL